MKQKPSNYPPLSPESIPTSDTPDATESRLARDAAAVRKTNEKGEGRREGPYSGPNKYYHKVDNRIFS